MLIIKIKIYKPIKNNKKKKIPTILSIGITSFVVSIHNFSFFFYLSLQKTVTVPLYKTRFLRYSTYTTSTFSYFEFMVCQPSSPCFFRVLAQRISSCNGPHDAYEYHAHSLFFIVSMLFSFFLSHLFSYTIYNTPILYVHTLTYHFFFSTHSSF